MSTSIPSGMCASFGLLCLVAFDSPVHSQTLRYAPETDSEYRYEFDIRFDLGVEETRLAGVTTYKVESTRDASTALASPDDEPVRLRFSGGLRETKKSKTQGGMPPRPQFPNFGPTFRPAYRGTSPTTNSVTLSSRGETLALVGESQLPYLLGNLSLLPFEPLPEDEETRWEVTGSTSVLSEQKQDPWRPFSPFMDRNDRDLRAAKTKLSYQILEQDDQRAIIQKDYRLTLSPDQTNATLELSGTGKWTFDKVAKMPLSMDFLYELTIQLEGVTVKAPLSLKYQRLTEDEIRQRQIEEEKRAAAAKIAAQERREASQRAITADEKTQWLDGLRSDKVYDQVKALNELVGRSPEQRDTEIVEAISALLKNSNRAVSMSAERALKKWDPAYKERVELEAKYARSIPLDSTGRSVDSETPLYVGQVVQVRELSRWWKAAEVTELLESGRVEVAMRDHWKERKVFERDAIELPPEAYVQPNPRPEVATTAAAATNPEPLTEVRTWKDQTGQFTIEAKLLLIANDNLVLSRVDGKLVTVPIAKMSDADQTFLKGLSGGGADPANPFEPN